MSKISSRFIYMALIIPVILLLGFFLRQVFMGVWILPQVIHLGPLYIHYYGFTMALAVGSAFFVAQKRARLFNLDQKKVDNWLLGIALTGFVFARLYHAASSWSYYAAHPVEIIYIWHGGLSIFGALIGGFLALLFLSFRELKPSWQTSFLSSENGIASKTLITPTVTSWSSRLLGLCDWLIPSVLIGQMVGRFGNLFNYEAFGYATHLPWKMYVPILFRPEGLSGSSYFHPLFLYEAIGNLIILVAILWYEKRKSYLLSGVGKATQKLASGTLFFMYLFLYNTLRFFLEFLRVDSTFISGGIRLNSLTSLILALVGVIGLYWIYQRKEASS